MLLFMMTPTQKDKSSVFTLCRLSSRSYLLMKRVADIILNKYFIEVIFYASIPFSPKGNT